MSSAWLSGQGTRGIRSLPQPKVNAMDSDQVCYEYNTYKKRKFYISTLGWTCTSAIHLLSFYLSKNVKREIRDQQVVKRRGMSTQTTLPPFGTVIGESHELRNTAEGIWARTSKECLAMKGNCKRKQP